MRRSRDPGRAALPSAPATVLATLTAAVTVTVLTAGPASSETAATGRGRPAVQPAHVLAILLDEHVARSAPDTSATVLQVVKERRPITGARTVLPVLGRRSPNGVGWLRVRLPGRPNGGTGWIERRGTRIAHTSWHIVVDTSERRVTVYGQGRPVRALRAVVGKPATPTPHGKFFVEEAVQLRAGDVGAPFALALSARSNVLQEFDGGPGQIALHGRSNIGGVLGSAASHGCVRLDDNAMRWLVVRIGPGVPVTIKR
jgi:lipoprotein-anchoring transpeptidase ErfK/SrfK